MRATFDLIEAAAERGNAEAEAAKEWISETINESFALLKSGRIAFDPLAGLALNGCDPCERVAEALAVWLKESAPQRFANMTATRYLRSGVDSSADGMERLRDQNEIILLAYPGDATEATPDSLVADWIRDMESSDQGDGFDYDAAEHSIRLYLEEDGRQYLEAILAERRQLAEREPMEEDAGSCDSDWPPFRLYLADSTPDAD